MTEEFKGTTGCWQVIESPLHGLIVIQEDSLDEGTSCISYTQIASEFQCEEDAKLIAAAPELLEACLRIQAQFRQAGIESKVGSMNPVEDNAAQIDAVILKVLGE
ncbi:hypothetical protein [Rosenbergiella australiborealis]|uniref:hypothetical protein n=1 Tax=Rosenbergiella australiborealis TaxID=1544696 RepID=UPI001F4D4C4D|nr:hypothetical protein [Rosenbergiella australiborealis]